MKNILFIVPLSFLLAGCPGGQPAPHPRATFINGDRLCFSTNKKDVLNYYSIDSSEKGNITSVISSGYEKLHSYYPDNCMNIKWKYGYNYVIHYGLNDRRYVHQFVIDNKG
jgi:hypothetical protein